MSEPDTQGDESREQLEEVLQRHIARERASIRLGFPLAVVVLIFLVIWFIVWGVNAGPVEKALVEIMSRRIDLPESRFTYPLDGAPLLEMQWGRGEIPASPFQDPRVLDFLVLGKSGQWALIPGEKGKHEGLVIAADAQVTSATLSRVLKHETLRPRCWTIWLASRTSEIVGNAGEEIKLKPEEMSNLGVLPISLRCFRATLPPRSFPPSAISLAPSDTFADAVRQLDAAYRRGQRDSLLIQIQSSLPPRTPSAGTKQ